MERRDSSESTATVGIIVALTLIVILLCAGGAAYLWYRSTMLRQQELLARAIAEKQQQMASQMAGELVESLAESARKNAPSLRILAWNIESGGNDPVVIAEQLAGLKGYDIYALSEVRASNVKRYAMALEDSQQSAFRSIVSQTGNDDRLAVLFDSTTLDLMAYQELFSFGDVALNDWNHRSPQVCHFRHLDSKAEFLVVNNHLARVNADLRTQQARGLREWAAAQSLPVIAVGDYNLDYDFHSEMGNAAFAECLAENTWRWLKPDPLVDTNWSDRDGDGQDDYPDSMLGFVFLAKAAKSWDATCTVIVNDGDFPDDERTSDHRPVEVVITGGQN